jgi:hypothetical protein
MAAMPPPPPPEEMSGSDDVGFTKEELSAQLEEIGDSDEKRSTLIENIIANFDEADSDGDGRVNMAEAMAFDQTDEDASRSTTEVSSDLAAADREISEQITLQLMRLMQAYNLGGGFETEATTSSLSVSV